MSQLGLPALIALAGAPNCGKTALFNRLTGSRQKVANYSGVTVERIEGLLVRADGRNYRILDLPGTYSLEPRSPDERVLKEVLDQETEKPELYVVVIDATQLRRHLSFVLEFQALGLPCVVAMNMIDLARAQSQEIDLIKLSELLKCPVVAISALTGEGIETLISELDRARLVYRENASLKPLEKNHRKKIHARFKEVERILGLSVTKPLKPSRVTAQIDRIAVHPVFGPLALLVFLGLIFQSVFEWAKYPQALIQNGILFLGVHLKPLMGEGFFSNLLFEGVFPGVGSVLVFLPQILILFAAILLLEDSGYMARAAFLMDRLMGRVGLHGRAFIPLLSSYACAIPGILSTRTIENKRDRIVTILVAPLMTCSARLPVYTLLISALIPDRKIFGPFHLQGLVLLGLYVLGLVAGLFMAFVWKRILFNKETVPLILELPTYKMPSGRSIARGLYDRAKLFLKRAGTVILALMIGLWFLSSYPKPPADAVLSSTEPAISYSIAGKMGHAIEPLLRPLGFDWRMSVALIPGFAAREVIVGALATVYAIESQTGTTGEEVTEQVAQQKEKLTEVLRNSWSLPTALSLLIWMVFAPQCISTLAVTKRETASFKWPLLQFVYLLILAYFASFATFRIASFFF